MNYILQYFSTFKMFFFFVLIQTGIDFWFLKKYLFVVSSTKNFSENYDLLIENVIKKKKRIPPTKKCQLILKELKFSKKYSNLI